MSGWIKRLLRCIRGKKNWNARMSESLQVRIISTPDDADNNQLYCYMDDTDVEHTSPIELSAVQQEQQERIKKEFRENHSNLFKGLNGD